MKQRMFITRKFKYGAAAVILSALFIAAVILINAVITAIDSNVGLYVDLTSEKIYGITDPTRNALSEITLPVEIIFCQAADKIDEDWYLSKVKRLAEAYAAEFPNVSLKYFDIVADPTLVFRYKTTSAQSIPNTSVIVSCPQTDSHKVFARAAFFTYTDQGARLFGFNGEMRLTAAILQTARPDTPLALFTTGHGESVSYPLAELLDNAGYAIELIDLKTEQIKDTARLLIVSSPQNDFTGLDSQEAGHTNEVAAINRYLLNSGGNLMVFLGPETPELPEFSEFLAEDWGIGYNSGQVIVERGGNSLDPDGYAVVGQYSTDKSKDSYHLHRQISEKASSPKTISHYTTPLSILFEQKNYRSVSAALFSSPSAEVRKGNDIISRGSSPMAVLSTHTKIENNAEKHARVLVFGSTYFTGELYAGGAGASSFGNADMINSALKLMGNQNVAIDLPFKPFDDTALGVDQTTLKAITLILSLLVPAIVLAAGSAVWLWRKRL